MKSPSTDPDVIMISGAGRGIGRAVAHAFLDGGYRLSLGVRDPEGLAAQYKSHGSQVACFPYDALNPASASAWVEATAATFGGINALINNAGINERVTIETYDDEILDRLWAVNIKAPLRLTRLCLPWLEATGRGRIVNVVSLSGKRVRNPHVGYSITKFAMMGLTHTLRHVAWEKGVRTTAVCPSFVRTDMTNKVTKIPQEEMTSPETLAGLIRHVVELPNNAAIAELLVNCRQEDML